MAGLLICPGSSLPTSWRARLSGRSTASSAICMAASSCCRSRSRVPVGSASAAGAEHGSHCFSRAPGDRRRRPHRHNHRGDRRPDPAARTRPLSRSVGAWYSVSPPLSGRCWGIFLRQPDLALDLYVNLPVGAVALSVIAADALAHHAPAARHRLSGANFAVRCAHRRHPVHQPRRPLSLGIAVHSRPDRRWYRFRVWPSLPWRGRPSCSCRSAVSNHTFAITSSVGLIVGPPRSARLPICRSISRYKGDKPNSLGSSLQLMPMMLGMLITSDYFGPPDYTLGPLQAISGRYRTVIMTVRAAVAVGISAGILACGGHPWMRCYCGCGMGMVMQVLVIAVQNSVDYEHLGVATGGTTLFRSRSARSALRCSAPFSPMGCMRSRRRSAARRHYFFRCRFCIVGAAEQLFAPLYQRRGDSLAAVFLVAGGVAALGFALTVMLREISAARRGHGARLGESFAMPRRHFARRIRTHLVRVLMARGPLARLCDLPRRPSGLPAPEFWPLVRSANATNDGAVAERGAQHSLAQLEAPLNALCDRDIVGKAQRTIGSSQRSA